jgi:hypothetical protein
MYTFEAATPLQLPRRSAKTKVESGLSLQAKVLTMDDVGAHQERTWLTTAPARSAMELTKFHSLAITQKLATINPKNLIIQTT